MKGILNGESCELIGETMPELPVRANGVFETLLLRLRAPVFWGQHWTRFVHGCQHYRLEHPSELQITKAIDELVVANGISDGVVRFAVWKGGADNAAADESTLAWRVDVGPPRAHMRRSQFVVEWGPSTYGIVPPDHKFKHLKRLVWFDALHAARGRGFDEALLCDSSGHLVEGCISNLFFVRDEVLHTPSLDLGPLPGIVRAGVLKCARSLGIQVKEGRFTRPEIEAVSEIWLTNSLIGIRPVAAIVGKTLPPNQPVLEVVRSGWQRLHGWDPAATAGS